MRNRIEEILSGFKPLFSRVSAYAWYVALVIGLMIRSDRLGLTSVIREKLASQNAANARQVDLIARMKLSAVAYREAPETRSGKRGRKPRKGEKVKLADLFETQRASFRTKRIRLYGKKQPVSYYAVDLLWGQGLYRKLRFVLAEYDGKRVVFISTNLSLHPSSIIRFYGYRFRIARGHSRKSTR